MDDLGVSPFQETTYIIMVIVGMVLGCTTWATVNSWYIAPSHQF